MVYRPKVRENWTEESFRWTLMDSSDTFAANSFALYGSLTKRIQGREIISLVLATLASKEQELQATEPNTKRFALFFEQLVRLIEQNWFMLDLQGYESLTAIAFLLLQSNVQKFFQFGLQILCALYKGEPDRHEYFQRVLPFVAQLWKNTEQEDSTKPIDEIIVNHLFHGLENKELIQPTLWLLEMLFSVLSNTLLLSNQILITILLVHHAICISNPQKAHESYHSIKSIGKYPHNYLSVY